MTSTEEKKTVQATGSLHVPFPQCLTAGSAFLGTAPGNNTRLMQVKTGPRLGVGSVQGTGEIAPQVAGVTGYCSGTKRHDEV